jgi:hypothetical protein
LEEQSLYDLFDFSGNKNYNTATVNDSGVSNRDAGATRLEAFLCPTDLTTIEPFPAHGNNWAPSSYKGVAGTVDAQAFGSNIFWDRLVVAQNAIKKTNRAYRGPLVAAGGQTTVEPTQSAQVTDGASKTALVGEAYAGDAATRRPAWASGWRYHNKGHFIRDATGKSSIYRYPSFELCARTTRDIPPGLGGDPNLCARAFASPHVGGVIQFVFCDGSVHSVRDVVDDDLFLALGTIAGEEAVNNGEL